MLQREVNRLKAKMDQRAIELLVEQQKVQDAEQRLQDADERQQEADERLQEHNGQLQASARTLHAAEAQLNAARRDFAKAHKQRQEAVSKMVEQGRQLASMEAKATEWEKVADVAR
jgi:chromosome segregation ATPase